MCVSLTTHRTSYSMYLPGMESECVDVGLLAVQAVRTSLGTPVAMCQCPTQGKMASATKASSSEILA